MEYKLNMLINENQQLRHTVVNLNAKIEHLELMLKNSIESNKHQADMFANQIAELTNVIKAHICK